MTRDEVATSAASTPARERAQRIRDHFAYESASEDDAHFQLAEREILAAEREAVAAVVLSILRGLDVAKVDIFGASDAALVVNYTHEAWLRARGEG